MRKLSFPGFLKKYLRSLSPSNAGSVKVLAKEAISACPRLREPLAIYAMLSGSTDCLLSAWEGTRPYELLGSVLKDETPQSLLRKLQTESIELPTEMLKVWHSYVSERDRYVRDDELKKMLQPRVISLQEKANVSTYQVSKDLGLNNSNVCTWLRTGDPKYVTLEAVEKMLHYFQEKAKANYLLA